ncbi:MAG: prolyl oligopeptidase family serine peptidase [Mucinivorans sp.]
MQRKLTALLATLLLTLINNNTNAQTKHVGNIVEYFGKEKIETTSEGIVSTYLNKGLLLPHATTTGTLFNGQDIIAWLAAKDNLHTPQANDTLLNFYPNKKSPQWQSIQADSNNTFRSPLMRSGYLYTPYKSTKEEIVLLEATGSTRTYINQTPHEGDHYDFGYSLIPVKMRKGINDIFYTPGRFAKVNAKIVKPYKPIQLTLRDMTLPDIIIGEKDAKWAAIRLINASEKTLQGLQITATLTKNGEQITLPTDDVTPMAVRKVKFQIPPTADTMPGEVEMRVEIKDQKGKVIDTQLLKVQARSAQMHHERTFLSSIDGSVQYYSVAPAQGGTEGKGLVLSVHGASVEARNQARAYSLKNDVTIVAPTNRRPFGFNWEEWGRKDAMEVLAHAKRIFRTDSSRTYLTGHSMGGHGTWYLGTTYPDRFAAIAPCASYPDIITYGAGRGDSAHRAQAMFEPIARAANGGRVLSMIENLKQSGVYVLHGDKDTTVPVEQVRAMRGVLAGFHPNFCYYEYPGGEHWYGNHSVDWNPIFEFFARQTIPQNKEVRDIDFTTASPVISASDYWVKVEQQTTPYLFSRVEAQLKGDTIEIKPQNVALLTLDLPSLALASDATLRIENSVLTLLGNKIAHLVRDENGAWNTVSAIDSTQKYAERQGGFKEAFDNNVVLVYATGGSRQENQWWLDKARFDAESFYYKGNGSLDVVADRDFTLEKYKNRNVVVYGNADNNSAWNKLLATQDIQVHNGVIDFAGEKMEGRDLGAYFVAPRPDSRTAMVGVVSGSGLQGARATWANNYISGITGAPEYMIFGVDMLRDGLRSVRKAGFLDNSWRVVR